MLSVDDCYTILQAKCSANNRDFLVRHHIDSYNKLIDESIPENIIKNNPIVINVPRTETLKDKIIDEDDIQQKMSELGLNEDGIKFYRIKLYIEDIEYKKPSHLETTGYHLPIEPLEARRRNLNYSITYYVRRRAEVCAVFDEKNEIQLFEIKIPEKTEYFSLPCMIMSNGCNLKGLTPKELRAKGEDYFERGGYFISKGSEKIIVSQESQQFNYPLLFRNDSNLKKFAKKELVKKKMVTEIKVRMREKLKDTYLYTCSVNSKMDHQKHPSPFAVYLGYDEEGIIWVHIMNGYIQKPIPLHVMFYALGVTNDKEILEFCANDLENKPFLEVLTYGMSLPVQFTKTKKRKCFIGDQKTALEYIVEHLSKTQLERIEGMEDKTGVVINNIRQNMFPHVGEDFRVKMFYLGYMTNNLLKIITGQLNPTDRDNFGYKRVDVAGPLILSIFNYNRQRSNKNLNNNVLSVLKKNYQEISRSALTEILSKYIIKPNEISSGLKRSFNTGTWVDVENPQSQKKGVTMLVSRKSPLDTFAEYRKMTTPAINEQNAGIKLRRLQATQYGMICPYDTPEGMKTGLVKNIALLCHISIGQKEELLRKKILSSDETKKIDTILPSEIKNYSKIFLNGDYLGVTKKPEKLVKQLRKERQIGKLHYETSIVRDYDIDEVRVFTDKGRTMMPLIRCKNNKLLITVDDVNKLRNGKTTWTDLLLEGKLEYLDVQEIHHNVILAGNFLDLEKADPNLLNYTHCIIHPSQILGVSASIIPFSNHNPGARNLFQSNMGKQAMTVYVSNFGMRMDTNGNILFYPQVPLVSTRTAELFGYSENPTGRNSMVAIACMSGYNQEDSCMLNQSSIERGFFHCVSYKTYISECGNTDEFMKPNPSTTKGYNKKLNYSKLNTDGWVMPGIQVNSEDILIGKVSHMDKNSPSDWLYTDMSSDSRCKEESAIVDKVYIKENQDGRLFNKTTLRIDRPPIVGDKFASTAAQKSTVGITFKQYEMPFTESGMTPDIIINPHAMPKRMTIGHLVHQLFAKYAVKHGVIIDGTPYNETSVEDIMEKMEKEGMENDGKEVMYNGLTGRKYEARICFGPTYYQRLKHLVADKIHARAKGPYQLLTRQPLEGRSKNGGPRVGEMETGSLISHGLSLTMKERFMECSDKSKFYVCNKCGLLAIANEKENLYECRACSTSTDISAIEIPYASKVFIQMVYSMGISLRLITEKNRIVQV